MKKRLIAWSLCCILLVFTGCTKHMADGPDMEYTPKWTSFTVLRSDSYAQYNFWFTVTDGWEEALLTGECRDEDGDLCQEEAGIRLSDETVWQLRRLDLEQLEDDVPQELEEGWEDLIILDAASVQLLLTLPDGTVVEKSISTEMSMMLYELLMPYLAK